MNKLILALIFIIALPSVFCDHICQIDDSGNIFLKDIKTGLERQFFIDIEIDNSKDLCIFGQKLAIIDKNRGIVHIINPNLDTSLEKSIDIFGDRISGIISVNKKLFVSRKEDILIIDENLNLLEKKIKIGGHIPLVTGGPHSLMFSHQNILGVMRFNFGEKLALINTDNLEIIANNRTLATFGHANAMAIGSNTLATFSDGADKAFVTTLVEGIAIDKQDFGFRASKIKIEYSNNYFAFPSSRNSVLMLVNEINFERIPIRIDGVDDEKIISCGNFFIALDRSERGFLVDTNNTLNNAVNFSQGEAILIVGNTDKKVYFTKPESAEKNTIFAITPSTFDINTQPEKITKINQLFSFDFSFYLAN